MTRYVDIIEKLREYFSSSDLAEHEQFFIEIDFSNTFWVHQRSISDGTHSQEDLRQVSAALKLLFGSLVKCVFNEDDSYTYNTEESMQRGVQIANNVWVSNHNTDSYSWVYEPLERPPLTNHKIVSFYSYSGGTGRTTALLLTALAMAQMGKTVVLLDFDYETPGFFHFFAKDQLPPHGVLDYLVDIRWYEAEREDICLQDYLVPISNPPDTDFLADRLYMVPAYGTAILHHPEDYRRSLMHTPLSPDRVGYHDFSEVDDFLARLDALIHPDCFLIDVRSGMHPMPGSILNRHSGLSLLFFTADQTDAFGMKMVLPSLKAYDAPYLLIHAKSSSDQTKAAEEHQAYLKIAYEATCLADKSYSGRINLDNLSGEHSPFALTDHPELVHASSFQELTRIYPAVQKEYIALAEEIIRRLPPYKPINSLADLPKDKKG